MAPTRARYDVCVIGGGPVGSATAMAFAQRGARVLLLEADPRASRRFAGEWIHPSGVAVLDSLRAGRLERAGPCVGYGFVLFPGDGSEPIELPYPRGIALSAPHEAIVSAVRGAALDADGVEFIPFAQVVSIEDHRVVATERPHGGRIEASADRIVGADGRSSVTRRLLGLSENSAVLSYMASVDLCELELPREGFGHVILGGPGPVLLYRVTEGLVRGCFDVPVQFGSASRNPGFLWEAFRGVLPEGMLGSFRRGLEGPNLRWAATRFRPRTDFGRGPVTLVGDALGHVHPMTAIGLSMGLLDAVSVAKSETLEGYARARRGYVPELLANALYHCFRRDDASARSMRLAMFRELRSSSEERRRTMQILSAEDESVASFGGICLRIAAGAIGSRVTQARREGGLGSVPGALAAFGEWMQWPAAALVPGGLRETYRGRSTATHPIPILRAWVPVTEEARATLAAASDVVPRRGLERREEAAPSIPSAMAKVTELLIVELEALSTQIGTTPDEVLAVPGLRMMRAITATEMRSGVAARMTIGRRWLARQGVPRLLEAAKMRGALATSELAALLLVLLGGAGWSSGQIVDLELGILALLRLQTDKGGFAPHASGLEPGDKGDVRTTALSCRALVAVRTALPRLRGGVVNTGTAGARLGRGVVNTGTARPRLDRGVVNTGETPLGVQGRRALEMSLDPDRLDMSIARAFHWLRENGAPDSSWEDSSGRHVRGRRHVSGSAGAWSGFDAAAWSTLESERIVRTACSVEALAVADEGEAARWVSKASRWLASCLAAGDLAKEDGKGDASRLLLTALTLRGVLASMLSRASQREQVARPLEQGLEREAVDTATRFLAKRVLETEPDAPSDEPADPSVRWEVLSEILETFALYEAVRKASSQAPVPADRPPVRSDSSDADWIYCRERLAEVSRSFSQPIALLPHHLEVRVTLAYLLCRVADSIEDHAAVPQASRAPLMTRLIDVLHGHEDPEGFARAFATAIAATRPGSDPELVLTCNLPVVMRVLRRESDRTRATLVRWIVEMARGMSLYTFRQPGADGIVALDTVSDLERYCYFVAGTVGHLLTDLFLEELGDEATPELALSLRIHAEPFGMGLQLVNILKDLTEDQARRWSFIPRTVCAARAVRVADLTDPSRRASAHAAVAPLFDIARGKLDDGMRYALAIPPHHASIRRFCLLPLWMAARTLVLARGGDAMFTAGAAVKIPREEVAALSVACVTFSGDDAELRARYAALWSDSALPEGRSAG
jgi:phytoene/squalene synthetase/2-polyprenyl-6-methoxyphenol hydroxylase-like FAD-dependent oxidoreductase